MDAWLRAYARHERDQAAGLEMSAATRRMLQAEVARHYRQARKEDRPPGGSARVNSEFQGGCSGPGAEVFDVEEYREREKRPTG